MLEKYGVKNVFAAVEIKEKIKQGFIEKYGMHPKQTEEVKRKCKEKLTEKYGVDSFSKTSEFKAKIAEIWENKSADEIEKHRDVSRSARANDPLISCIHCRKIVKNLGTFNRWHGDNCKLKLKD